MEELRGMNHTTMITIRVNIIMVTVDCATRCTKRRAKFVAICVTRAWDTGITIIESVHYTLIITTIVMFIMVVMLVLVAIQFITIDTIIAMVWATRSIKLNTRSIKSDAKLSVVSSKLLGPLGWGTIDTM
jgi:hypothetical protein